MFYQNKKKPEFFIDTYTESLSDHLLNIYILTDLFLFKKTSQIHEMIMH